MRLAYAAIPMLAAALWVSGRSLTLAQTSADEQNRTAQGKPSTKKPSKPEESRSGTKSPENGAAPQPAKSPSAAEDNPFPTAVSQKAQDAKERSSPDSGSESKPRSAASKEPHHGAEGAGENPFPEAQSERAARAAQTKAQPSPGAYSSSQSSSLTSPVDEENIPPVHDPATAKKDVQVGEYYMGSGDYRGAYLRFKDALKFDPANLDAIYGLAQAARQIGKYDEAARNYHVYLAVVSKGSRAKDARKALREMAGK